MFSWLSREENDKQHVFENVTEGLKKVYKTKLLPLEQHYQFHDFHSPQLDDPDFDATPMILLVGQYSTGKTTFIKYLLERDFPGIRIGPEPTTDRFIAVMYSEKEGVIPGNALVVDPKKQFRPLSKFGNAFLNRFQCSTVSSPVLKGISIVDTPGILSGEKQRVRMLKNHMNCLFIVYNINMNFIMYLLFVTRSIEATILLEFWNGSLNEWTESFCCLMHINLIFLMNLDDPLKHYVVTMIKLE